MDYTDFFKAVRGRRIRVRRNNEPFNLAMPNRYRYYIPLSYDGYIMRGTLVVDEIRTHTVWYAYVGDGFNSWEIVDKEIYLLFGEGVNYGDSAGATS